MASEPRLIVVSDIHGAPDAQTCLSHGLPVAARLSLGDLCAAPELSGEALHHHLFVKGAMRSAKAALQRYISENQPLIGLGYSAGGTALWQAAADGAPLAALMCVSSTRLRDAAPLLLPNEVIFGALDTNRPSETWMQTVPESAVILPNAEHAFYVDATHPTLPGLRDRLTRRLRAWHS